MDAEELPILGESIAVDFANSLYLDEGEALDFLGTPHRTTFWFDHASDDPAFTLPRPHTQAANRKLQELRDAVGEVLLSRLERTPPSGAALDVINSNAALAPAVARLIWPEGEEPRAQTQLLGRTDERLRGQLALAAIELLTGPEGDQLRRCEGPGCSLLFVRHHRRRRFCHESCSHRDRQMRYYRRQKGLEDDGPEPKGGRK